MRQGWERDKDRKRGMVGEGKIGRERKREREREGEGETGVRHE